AAYTFFCPEDQVAQADQISRASVGPHRLWRYERSLEQLRRLEWMATPQRRQSHNSRHPSVPRVDSAIDVSIGVHGASGISSLDARVRTGHAIGPWWLDHSAAPQSTLG